ncbi:MAG TPA: hypothetical protein PKY96_17760 [Flavobacteriales bacterium]|nr:hypothetical protein [Flavobacteriales bacterium]
MNTIYRMMALALLATAAPAALLAQEGTIGSEHRYQFTLIEAPTAFGEKLMMESLASLDPEMRIDVDRMERTVKVLAYRPLDAQSMANYAASLGVNMVPRRTRMEAAEPTRTNP